jgi:hypothetical protein
VRTEPAAALTGHVAVPGDKSISHRAVLLGAIADGETRVDGFGRSEDTEATIAAAQHRHALGGDRARRLERLLPGLDRARAGDEAEVAVADAAAAGLDHGWVGGKLARDELVRLEDRQHLLDTGEALERQRREQLPLPDRADHGGLAAGRDERRAPRLVEPRDNLVHLLLGRARPHHDQQLGCACDRHRDSLGRITLHGRRPARNRARQAARLLRYPSHRR